MTLFFSAEGGPIWIKFRRLVQNDMSTAVIWSKSKPDAEFQYGGHLGELNGMSSQSHVSHCRVLPLGELTVMIPEPHATLQGAVTWRNQCHDRATLQGVRIPNAVLKIVFHHILFYFVFNAVWAAAFVSSPIHFLLFTSASDLPMRSSKFCSVVFDVTSRLSFCHKQYSLMPALRRPSPAINKRRRLSATVEMLTTHDGPAVIDAKPDIGRKSRFCHN